MFDLSYQNLMIASFITEANTASTHTNIKRKKTMYVKINEETLQTYTTEMEAELIRINVEVIGKM